MGRDRAGVAGWRAAALLTGLVAGAGGACRLAAPPLAAAWSGDASTPETTVAAACAGTLLVAVAWLCAVSCAVAVAAVRRPGRPLEIPACPRVLRVVVLALLGCGVAISPAAADGPGAATPPVAARMQGLALPDRVVGGASTRRAAGPDDVPGRHLEVAPGDTLWGLAARLLPPDADVATVDRAWRALARANRDRIGPDPDLIFPGTVLRVPHPLAPGKDPS